MLQTSTYLFSPRVVIVTLVNTTAMAGSLLILIRAAFDPILRVAVANMLRSRLVPSFV